MGSLGKASGRGTAKHCGWLHSSLSDALSELTRLSHARDLVKLRVARAEHRASHALLARYSEPQREMGARTGGIQVACGVSKSLQLRPQPTLQVLCATAQEE